MAEIKEKEEINYASVVFKNKNNPPPEVGKEDEIVYDEVKTKEKTAEQTGETNAGSQPHKDANSGWLPCCLGILCIILVSVLIALGVILTLNHKTELNQLKEKQTSLLAAKDNLTELNHKLSSANRNLTREHNNLTRAYAVLESNVTDLTSQITNLTSQNLEVGTQNQKLKGQITNLTSQNQEVGTQNQQLREEKNNLTARIQELQKLWNQNISQAQKSVDLYCPITNGQRKCNPCLPGWTAKPPNCYAVNNAEKANQKTWESAQEDCKGKDSDLAVIANEQEKTSVGEALWNGITNNKFWIGLRAENGKWKWLNGSELTHNSWIEDPTDGQCALFRKDNTWTSEDCDDKNQWICQQKALTLT